MLERLQRLLLRLSPASFRDAFGQELVDTARAIDAERPRRPRRILAAAADILITPWAVRADLRADAHRLPRERTLPMSALLRDLVFAFRGLRRDPGFTAFAVATLALGIGANTAMFGLADRLLMSGPEHVRDADRVLRLYASATTPTGRVVTTQSFGYATYGLLAGKASTLDAVATYTVNTAVLGSGADARSIRLGYATASLFPLLGVQPAAGRFFTEAEDAASGAARVLVLSEGAARAWCGGVAESLGRTLTIGTDQFTVIGVAPHGFTGPQLGPVDAWAPGSVLGSRVTTNWTTAWNAQWLQIVGRLKPGVTPEQAGAEATSLFRAGYGGTGAAWRAATLSVRPLSADRAGGEPTDARVLRWLTGVSALVLLIACANIANLMAARGLRRTREVAVRAALGAGRLQLVRLLMFEVLLLAAGGALAGVAIAYQIGSAARARLFTNIEWTSAPVSPRVFLAALGLAAGTAALIALWPALGVSRVDLSDTLKTGAREGGGRRSFARSALTVVQATLSVVLLVGAGLFAASLWRAYRLDLGFDADHVTVLESSRRPMSEFPAGPAREAEGERRRRFEVELLERVRQLPGVTQASVATGMPFGNTFTVGVRPAGVANVPWASDNKPSISAVADGYFDTMGTPVLRGRAFTAADHAGTERVAIVSRRMADTVWPGEDPIGKCLLVGDSPASGPAPALPCTRVVGVAGDTYLNDLREEPAMHYYIPAGQEEGFGGAVMLVRTGAGATAAVEDVRRLIASADSTVTFVRAASIRSLLDPQMRSWKLGASVFAVSGVLALVVAAIGIYSVMSYLVAGRRREIGVRLSLGARKSDILALVFGGSVSMAVIGVVIGEAIALALGGLAEPLLFRTSARDPLVFGGVAALILAAALVATAGPAHRAGRIDAAEALRSE